MHSAHDTIAAIASAPGGAMRGVVRVSGPGAAECVAPWFHVDAGAAPGADASGSPDSSASFRLLPPIRSPQSAIRNRNWLNAKSAQSVDGALRLAGLASPLPCRLYYWPNERSYTRQPTIELHTLGSPPLLQAVLRAVCTRGARVARPGEFTLRAFLAGRLDLTQAEAVLGVIDANDRRQLDVALEQLAGNVARPLSDLRAALLDVLAHLEAGLDFVEEDIEFISPLELDGQLARAEAQIEQLVARMVGRGEAIDQARVVLLGEPNVGKSSLFNALVGRGAALVSPQAGTTRDWLTAPLALDGVTCQLIDTAGLEHAEQRSDALLRAQAQLATARQAGLADIELLCLDSSRPLSPREVEAVNRSGPRPRLIVWTKTDTRREPLEPQGIETSAREGIGLDVLRRQLARQIRRLAETGDAVAATATRCRESLRAAQQALARGRQLAAAGGAEELVAAELREALHGLGEVAGEVVTDDVLDRIFSRFCIGK